MGWGGWFGSVRTGKARASAPPAALRNAATQVSVDGLIDLQRHAGSIDLNRAHPARAPRAGSHLAHFRGRGMDYQESRVYQPGDDVRSMDWRVTARTGRAHVKLYEEERERPVMLCLDLRAGMFFGSRGRLKSVVAAQAAAIIGWAAVAQGDRIGAMLFNGAHCDLPPRGGRHGVLALIRQLVADTDPVAGMAGKLHAQGLNAALRRLRRVSRPGSLVLLLSDFHGIDDATSDNLLRLRQHNDVAALQIVDPLEVAAPAPGRYGVVAEGGPGLLDTRSVRVRRAYEDHFNRHHQAIAACMRRCAIAHLRVSTADDIAADLRKYFVATRGYTRPHRRAA
jgi:uncharacterized protein (DUF58 family)